MQSAISIDQQLRIIHQMTSDECIETLLHFSEIPLDFDRAFLELMSVEKLRHVLVAAMLTVHRRLMAG